MKKFFKNMNPFMLLILLFYWFIEVLPIIIVFGVSEPFVLAP